jgi:hypothetical protein
MQLRYVSNGLVSFTLLAGMYSFGTFGLFNLFGVRLLVQIVVIGLMANIFVMLPPQYKSQDRFSVVLFFTLFALCSLFYNGQYSSVIEAIIMLFITHIIFSASKQQILSFSKALVYVTSILCILVITAYAYYKISPDQVSQANINIYDSTVGTAQVYPSHFMDWISFTSGEGFEFQGNSSLRMKGYSNEPSSTIVHYLAPAVLAFFLGGRFAFLGVFILIVNMIAIASFIGHIIFTLSLMFFIIYIGIKYYSNYIKYVIPIVVVFFIVLISKLELLITVFEYVGGKAIDLIGFDLISRKVSGDSLVGRQSGVTDCLSLLLLSPFGYPIEKIGAGAGLLYSVSARTGWLGVGVFVLFIIKLISKLPKLLLALRSNGVKYSISLLSSVLLVTLFVSGYGWERPPGLIMLLLFFRIVQQTVEGGHTTATPDSVGVYHFR